MDKADDLEHEIKWWTGPVKCSLCGHEAVAVVPISIEHDEPIVSLECANCGNMTARVE